VAILSGRGARRIAPGEERWRAETRQDRGSQTGLQELRQKLQEDGFADLKGAQRWLEERFGVHYSLSGVWYLVRVELKAELKTGRPQSAKQDPQAVEAFKKEGSRRWRIERSGRRTRPDSA